MEKYLIRECEGRMMESYRDGSYQYSRGGSFVIRNEQATEAYLVQRIAGLDDEVFCRFIDNIVSHY